ncbi:MAG: carbohydrate kinase family protein [Patescibacteria group bacterium]|nr:carbohydrate kinase family protein [Patescibacteria group bacterium]
MLYDIAVIGDCVQDTFILARSKIIKEKKDLKYLSYLYGEKIGIDELKYDLGGSACNAGVAMKKMGIKNAMVSMLGDDMYSREVVEELKRKKVGTSFLVKQKNKNLGRSFILLGVDRDRTILTFRPENDYKRMRLKKVFLFSKGFYIAGITRYSKIILPDIYKHILKTKKPLYMNPSIYQIENDLPILKRLISRTKILCLNVEEAKNILKIKKRIDIKELLKKIKNLGTEIIVITDGRKGSYVYDGKTFYKSGIYPSKRVDTTGAGDSFAGTFVAMHKKGYNIEDCLKLASINSANVVSVYGAQKGLLGEREILKRYNKNKVRVKKF